MDSATYASDTTWPRFQAYLPPENRLSAALMPEEYFLRTYGGWEIHIDRYMPDGAPRARVVILHGSAGNGRLMSFLAVPLVRAGHEVLCPDLPLYGLTRAAGDILYRDWLDVAETVVDHAADDQVPLFVAGVSVGGLLAYQVADRCNRDALAAGRAPVVAGVMATCIADPRDARTVRQAAANPLMGALAAPMLENLVPAMGSLPLPFMLVGNVRAVVNDRSLAQLLLTDAKSGGALVPLVFVQSLLQAQREPEPEDFLTAPVLVAHPARDRWTRPALSRRFFDRLACPKVWVDLEGAGHLPVEALGLAELETACLTFMECFG